MDENLNITLPNTDITLEQMPSIPEGDNPFNEVYDWIHTYTKVTDDVYIGYSDERLDNDPDYPLVTKYIIVGHLPTGQRLKIRFTGDKSPLEDWASIPRHHFEGLLNHETLNRKVKHTHND